MIPFDENTSPIQSQVQAFLINPDRNPLTELEQLLQRVRTGNAKTEMGAEKMDYHLVQGSGMRTLVLDRVLLHLVEDQPGLADNHLGLLHLNIVSRRMSIMNTRESD
jgi:hypothetical protein